MKKRTVEPFLIGAALLVSTAGCQSVHQCCTSWFAARGTTFADSTPLPEKAFAAKTVSASSPTAEKSAAGDPVSPAAGQRRFNIPEELPGADAAPLVLPPMDPTQSIEERRSLADALFPDVVPAEVHEGPAADSVPLTLSTMQQMGVENSPVIRQAAADVEQTRGKAIQAGLYPNPTVGYQGDTIGTARTAGYNGVFFTQEFVTAGKLTLAQNVALNEVRAAQADLRKARIRLASDIRRGYFKVLISQEQLKFNRAIAKLSDEVYRAQIDLVTGGEAAPYEPLQLRVFAVQARNSVTQSANALDASWRQLAAAVGMPHMTRQRVAGSADLPVPEVDYSTLAAMLQRHSDLIAANSRIASSGSNLRLQEAIPIPNVTLYAAFQHDDTTPLSDYSTNLQLSAPVPVFNRNQGNITTAHAGLVRARQDLNNVNNTLMSQLAETYNRYATSRTISESYRTDLLPDQVRVYRGVYDRFLIDGESIDFAQVVVAQQTLAQVVTSYLQSLTDAWMATVDLAELMQVDDLITMDGMTGQSDAAAVIGPRSSKSDVDSSGTSQTTGGGDADGSEFDGALMRAVEASASDGVQDSPTVERFANAEQDGENVVKEGAVLTERISEHLEPVLIEQAPDSETDGSGSSVGSSPAGVR
jgi:cobalt-zinc-cadmium efflux system outer membrane protein